jgi:flagellin-like hook-associated protein FlgL
MINFTPIGSALDLSHTTSRRKQAIANLSSGSREDLRLKDVGTFSMNSRVKGHVAVERKLQNNMQNLLSYSQLQDGKLQNMAKLVTRMSELAAMSTDVIQTVTDRSNYNREFLNLTNQFDDIQNETFNGIKLFGNGSSEEAQEFLNSLKTHWLAATEKVVEEEYGWTADSGDSWDLIIEENGPVGGSAAFVQSSYGGDYASQAVKMSFDLPDFRSPHTVGSSTADTTVAHEMVHLLQAQNTYMGDQAGGDPDRDMTWLAEGLAEFIIGADYRASTSITQLGGDPAGVTALVQKPAAGWGSTSDDYAGAYLAVKYLDDKIRSSGSGAIGGIPVTDGVKHLTTWMKAQRDANAGASASGLNQYIETYLNGTHGYGVGNAADTSGQAIDDLLSEFESPGGGIAYIDTLDLSDDDTGSIHGIEYGGAVLNSSDVIFDNPVDLVGYNSQLNYVSDQSSVPITMSFSGDGDQSTLNPISPLSFGDTTTYNLASVESATLTMEYLESLMASIAQLRASVGGNISVTENNLDALSHRTSALAQSISRTGDTSIENESLQLAKTAILLEMNVSMRVQANQVASDITMTLLR